MKSLKLLFTIALPLFALLSSLPSAASPSLLAQARYEQTCLSSGFGYLWTEESGSPINIRDDASTQSYARHIAYKGDLVQVLDHTLGDDGYCWYRIKFPQSGAVGWVRGDFIVDASEGE